ncbi:hypothetical protein THICB2_220078 [Thiomonas sp. CB2]|uniref:Uncharacterized protein n=1 Tax=Thiomonas delicata TaxID=364030 RepID=A0A238D2U3_THIDL|nr:hypothetical protein THICB2_220078 [Thiomonas sp. CB2]CQR44800.1 hypothetical protein THICB3560165 [Thiomonas sp. CB3]SBP87559.1 hypothetical protein THIARS_60272 [Thiomonas delicata]VDY10970.1 protein of unknown function [Thiomonas sp. Sup16B3]VDY16816.1 protein of unknown function [Thiomonas sp. CB2]
MQAVELQVEVAVVGEKGRRLGVGRAEPQRDASCQGTGGGWLRRGRRGDPHARSGAQRINSSQPIYRVC